MGRLGPVPVAELSIRWQMFIEFSVELEQQLGLGTGQSFSGRGEAGGKVTALRLQHSWPKSGDGKTSLHLRGMVLLPSALHRTSQARE